MINIKIKKVFFFISIIVFILLILLITFSYFNDAKENIFLTKDFCSWSNSFLPASLFYFPQKITQSFFDGELIYNKKSISPYIKTNVFDNLTVYSSNEKLIGFTNLSYPHEKLKKNDIIEFSENNSYCFIIEKGIFLNPIDYLKPLVSSSVSIINVYYLNKENIAVAFRQNYKDNVIPILINAYSTYLSGRFAFSSNVYKLEIYLDNEMIYKRELDKISKKQIIELISTSSRPQFIKYIVSNVSNGEHILKIKVFDIFDHVKEIQKKFNVKSY